jgi:rubrerythrin
MSEPSDIRGEGEGAGEREGHTRATFILRGALAVGATYGAGAVAPFVSNAFAAVPASDLTIVQFALGLEQLETAFYKAALARAGLSGDAKKLATEFGAQEAQHANALNQLLTQLGGKPPPASTPKFGLTNQASFLKLAVQLEDTGVGAYSGAAPAVKTPDLLATFGAIVQTEARHSSALRVVAGMDPSPQAFDKPLTTAQVQAAVQPFIK